MLLQQLPGDAGMSDEPVSTLIDRLKLTSDQIVCVCDKSVAIDSAETKADTLQCVCILCR